MGVGSEKPVWGVVNQPMYVFVNIEYNINDEIYFETFSFSQPFCLWLYFYSLVMMISMAKSVKHNVPYVQDTRSVHVRRCMATARAPLVTKDTFALMTVRWTDMACIARKCVSVR